MDNKKQINDYIYGLNYTIKQQYPLMETVVTLASKPKLVQDLYGIPGRQSLKNAT